MVDKMLDAQKLAAKIALTLVTKVTILGCRNAKKLVVKMAKIWYLKCEKVAAKVPKT